MGNLETRDGHFDEMFSRLYRDLCDAFPHPFEWIGLMEKPKWWRFKARAAHRRVWLIFMSHGFILTDQHAENFRRLPGQGAYGLPEDAGGAIVRRLRQTFQYQLGVPYSMTTLAGKAIL